MHHTGAVVVALFLFCSVGSFVPPTTTLRGYGHSGNTWRGFIKPDALLPPLSVSKKDKALAAEERKRVEELAAVQRNVERGELRRELEAALSRGEGLIARDLLRKAERGSNPDLAMDAELISIAIQACSKGGRHADVIDLHGKLVDNGSSTDGELDALALIASASLNQWPRAERLLEALLSQTKSSENPWHWEHDEQLRFSALATAAETGNSKAAAKVIEGCNQRSSDEVLMAMTAHLKAKKPGLALRTYENSNNIKFKANVHHKAIEALLAAATAADSEQSDGTAAKKAFRILDTLRSLVKSGASDAEAELSRCLEAAVNIILASNTTAQGTWMAFEIFTDLPEGYEPSAATVSAMIARLIEAGYTDEAVDVFETSAFHQNARPLTERVRVLLFNLSMNKNVSAMCILDTLLLDDSLVSIAGRYNDSIFDANAIGTLCLSSDPSHQRQALDLALILIKQADASGRLYTREDLLLKTLALDPRRSRSELGELWYRVLEFLVSRTKEEKLCLSRDVCHKLLLRNMDCPLSPFEVEFGRVVKQIYERDMVPDRYVELVRDMNHLCLDDSGILLDGWWMAARVASGYFDAEDLFAGCKMIDAIAVEAQGSSMELYAGENGIGSVWLHPPGQYTAAWPNLWDDTDDTSELWKRECYLAKAEAITFVSLVDHPQSFQAFQVPNWFIPVEGSELLDIIQSASRLDGFLVKFRKLVSNQCIRRDVLGELIGWVAEGKFDVQVEGTNLDLLGTPFWEDMFDPGNVISPIWVNPEGGLKSDASIGKGGLQGVAAESMFVLAQGPVNIIADLARLKSYFVDVGVNAEFLNWAKRRIGAGVKYIRNRYAFELSDDSDTPPEEFKKMWENQVRLLSDIDTKISDSELQKVLQDELWAKTDHRLQFARKQNGPDKDLAIRQVNFNEEMTRLAGQFLLKLEASLATSNSDDTLVTILQLEATKKEWMESIAPDIIELCKQFGVLDEDTQQYCIVENYENLLRFAVEGGLNSGPSKFNQGPKKDTKGKPMGKPNRQKQKKKGRRR